MAKDPAVLFYTSDFLTGTALMNYEEKGRYIYLLCLQHQMGGISQDHMKIICESYEDHMETATETRVRERGVGKGEGIPVISEVEQFFVSSGFKIEVGRKAFEYYNSAGWKDSKGNTVRNWKQKMISVWFTDDAKQTVPQIDMVKARAEMDDFHNSRLGPADRVEYPKDDDHVDE